MLKNYLKLLGILGSVLSDCARREIIISIRLFFEK